MSATNQSGSTSGVSEDFPDAVQGDQAASSSSSGEVAYTGPHTRSRAKRAQISPLAPSTANDSCKDESDDDDMIDVYAATNIEQKEWETKFQGNEIADIDAMAKKARSLAFGACTRLTFRQKPKSSPELAHLLRLPVELQLKAFKYLLCRSRCHLALTCPQLPSVVLDQELLCYDFDAMERELQTSKLSTSLTHSGSFMFKWRCVQLVARWRHGTSTAADLCFLPLHLRLLWDHGRNRCICTSHREAGGLLVVRAATISRKKSAVKTNGVRCCTEQGCIGSRLEHGESEGRGHGGNKESFQN